MKRSRGNGPNPTAPTVLFRGGPLHLASRRVPRGATRVVLRDRATGAEGAYVVDEDVCEVMHWQGWERRPEASAA